MSKPSRRDVLKASVGLGLGAAVTGCATAGQAGDVNLVPAAPRVLPGDMMVCGIDKVGELHVKVA